MSWKPWVASTCILVTFKRMEMSVVGDEGASKRLRLVSRLDQNGDFELLKRFCSDGERCSSCNSLWWRMTLNF